ncbi:solute carrier family 25 protein, partial [Neocallimastix lanati (nom. inval.)]
KPNSNIFIECSMTGSKSLDEAVAGIGAGLISTLTLHPLETTEGYKGLYQGLSPNLIGNTISWLFNEKEQYRKKNNGNRLTKFQHMAASSQAGIITQVSTTPIWLINKNVLNIMSNFINYLDFYKGMLPTLIVTSHGAIQFMAYEEMKILYKNQYPHMNNPHHQILATLITYPYQVIRARLQNQRHNEFYHGCLDAIKKIYIREGYNGYYKGMSTNIIRVFTKYLCFSSPKKDEDFNINLD